MGSDPFLQSGMSLSAAEFSSGSTGRDYAEWNRDGAVTIAGISADQMGWPEL